MEKRESKCVSASAVRERDVFVKLVPVVCSARKRAPNEFVCRVGGEDEIAIRVRSRRDTSQGVKMVV